MTTLDLALEHVRLSPPPKGANSGHWDWFRELTFGQQMDARRFMVKGGMGPDELATHLGTDIDDAMARWLAAVRVARGIGAGLVDEWDARPELPELLGVQEVAHYLGISRQRIHVLRKEGRFPEPFASLACGDIWRSEDITSLVR